MNQVPPEINDFRFEYRWLSNFHLYPIHYEGRDYPSTEHAYQAAKVENDQREPFQTGTSREVKVLGRRTKITRLNWDVVKVQVMMDLLRLKFTPGSELGAKLIATGDAGLVEGNTWGDKFWGVCNGQGRNQLGILLMTRREELRRIMGGELVTSLDPGKISASPAVFSQTYLEYLKIFQIWDIYGEEDDADSPEKKQEWRDFYCMMYAMPI